MKSVSEQRSCGGASRSSRQGGREQGEGETSPCQKSEVGARSRNKIGDRFWAREQGAGGEYKVESFVIEEARALAMRKSQAAGWQKLAISPRSA